MEQNSSNRVVSLHLEKCTRPCRNEKICYHLNKKLLNYDISSITKWLKEVAIPKGYTIYDSICNLTRDLSDFYSYDNYNITINSKHINGLKYSIDKSRLQITIHNDKDIRKYINYQKLYLIHDDESLSFAIRKMKDITGYLHFVFYQNYIDKEKLLLITNKFTNRVDKKQSLDSCYSSWLLNGKCPYEKDYIDISYDGSIRKCPFQKIGAYPKSFKNIFRVKPKQERCIYEKIFG